MKNEWHVVKEDDRYVVLDNSSLSKLVPSITKLNPNKSTSGHKHAGQEEVYVFYKGTGIMPVSYTHLRAHETSLHLVCRLLLEKKK